MKRLLILLIVFNLTSCKKIIGEVFDASSSKSENLSSENYNEVTIEGRYKLSVPQYMKEISSLHDEASLKYGNIFKETYTVVIDENKQEFVEAFKENNEYNEQHSVIENYSEIQVKFMRERIDVTKVIPYNVKQIGNLNARQVMLNGTVDGMDITYVICFLEGKDNLFFIMNWTLPERINKYENTFKTIIDSFKLIEK